MSDRQTLRVPINQAASKGVSWLTSLAEDHNVVLTKFGRPTAVVSSAEDVDANAQLLEEARRVIVESMSDVALSGAKRFSLEEACERLGIDPERVRNRTPITGS